MKWLLEFTQDIRLTLSFSRARIGFMFLLALFAFQIISVATSPLIQIATAQSNESVPSEAVLANYEVTKQLLAQISLAEQSGLSPDFFAIGLLVATYDNNKDFSLSNKASEKISVSPAVAVKFGLGERKLAISKVINVVLNYNYKDGSKGWLDKIYATDGTPNEPSFVWEGRWWGRYSNVNTADLLKGELSKYISAAEARPEFSKAWTAYKRRQVKAAFSVCYRLRDGMDPSKESSYDYNPGFNAERAVDAGYAVETSIGEQGGEYEDGRLSCKDLMQGYLLGKYYDDSVSEEFEQDVKAQAIRDLLTKDAEAQAKFWFCVGKSAPALTNLPLADVLTAVSEWLATGDDTKDTVITSGSLPFPVSAATMKAIAACLVAPEAFGDKLQDLLDDDFISGDQDESDVGAEEDTGDDCYDSIEPLFTIPGGIKVPNPLKWAVCGISQLLAGLIDSAVEGVRTLLHFDPTKGDGASDLKTVWSSIVGIANILLIVAFLIMVISTALDLGIFSNYTVKKLLPRIIIAALLANLSWDICRILIEITNIVGEATQKIILSPLSKINAPETLQGAAGQLFVNNTGSIAAIGVGAIVYGTIASAGAILVPIMVTVAIGVIIALMTLLLRRIIIIMLIVAAPLAFLALAFPGGDKLLRKWWKTFTQMLLIFPMAMALFASGVLISGIMSRAQPDKTDLVSQALQIIVLFLPFFALPMLFKAASSTLGNITGMMNDRTKGIIDNSKKKAAMKKEQNFADWRAGTLEGRGPLKAGVRRMGAGVGAGWKGRYGMGDRGRAATSANLRGAATDKMKDPAWQQVQHDDRAMRAATYETAAAARLSKDFVTLAPGKDRSSLEAGQFTEEDIGTVAGTVGFGRKQQVAAAQQMLLNKTAYKDSGDVARTIARVSHGNSNAESQLRGFNNSYAKQVGRHDLSAVSDKQISMGRTLEGVPGGLDQHGQQFGASWAAEQTATTVKGFENADTYTLQRENATSFTNMLNANQQQYQDAAIRYAQGADNRDEVVAARSRLEETLKTASTGTGVNAREVAKISDKVGIHDALIRQHRGAEAESLLNDATRSLGQGGVPRTGGTMSEEQRRAYEEAARKQPTDE